MVQEYIKACTEDEIPEGKIKAVELNGVPIAIARYNGQIYAVDDICTHDGGNLGEGNIINGQVQCPRHGARFDLKTGQVIRMPAVIGINTYEVKIENGEIFVAIPKQDL
jgi:3-phenylpropionate/trans-cinnamate dioxygenase ferredoxin component